MNIFYHDGSSVKYKLIILILDSQWKKQIELSYNWTTHRNNCTDNNEHHSIFSCHLLFIHILLLCYLNMGLTPDYKHNFYHHTWYTDKVYMEKTFSRKALNAYKGHCTHGCREDTQPSGAEDYSILIRHNSVIVYQFDKPIKCQRKIWHTTAC